MRWIGILALLPALSDVQAQDKVQRGPAPDWVEPSELLPVPDQTSGLFFVRRQDSLIHLGKNGDLQYVGYRIKILHPNALELGNFSLVWNPAAGAPVVHEIKIHRAGQVVDVLGNATFEVLRREERLEAAMLDGKLTATLRIADLRVGDELEVAMTTPANDPTLEKDSSGALILGADPPQGRFRLGLSWDDGQKPNVQMTPYMTGYAHYGDRNILFQFDNPATLSPIKQAPARYQWRRGLEYSDFPNWEAVSRRFAPLYESAEQLGGKSALKVEARRIAEDHATPLERASAALELVQQHVRYIYVGLGGGNLTPATAEETWQRRYGDCKGKTVLLLALLHEMGIEAEPVLVNSTGYDDGLNERLPNPSLFDHVLVRAKIDGADYWLDGTLPPVATPSAEPVIPYRWVLPLTNAGASLKKLEFKPANVPDNITLYEIDARGGFNQPARITTTEIVRGLKGLEQQVALSAVTQGQLLNAMRQKLTGDTWQEIDTVEWRFDKNVQASILKISGTGLVDWDVDNGRSYALPGGGFSPPPRRIRASDQDPEIPFANDPEFSCYVTTVRIPDDTSAKNWSFGNGFDMHIFGQNYYRAFDLRHGAIRMVRGFRVEKQEIDAAAARQDNERIASFDNSKAMIYYDPKIEDPAPTGAQVPATYEIDWVTENSACLSAETVR